MNDADCVYYGKLIRNRLCELEQEDALGKEAQSVVQLDQQSVGRLSRMDALQSQAMAKATQARRNAEKTRLYAALQRLSENEFGYCQECGSDIEEQRLKLDPAALKCLDCLKG